MPYNYTPRSEHDVLGLISENTYRFKIVGSTEKPSQKSGILMLVINLQIQSESPLLLEEYISYQPKMDWKIKHLCDSCGKSDIWESGKFDGTNNNLLGWEGYAVVKVDKKGDRPKNRVADFAVITEEVEAQINFPDDKLPF